MGLLGKIRGVRSSLAHSARDTRPHPRSPRRGGRIAVIVVAIVLVALAVIVAWWVWGPREVEGTDAPRLAVFSDTLAATHAASDPEGSAQQEAAAFLAEQPTALWLVPERAPLGAVADKVADLASEARAQGATSTLVVYGLPGRDCGNHSAGGLEASAYDAWTTEIGDAIRQSGTDTILILEPDSIALSNECGNIAERAEQLRDAIANLSSEYTTIYIDGGHSRWHSPELMAEMILDMGIIEDVRGVATNVSNFNDDAAELSYAHALASRLGGTHAVIDTSRSGVGSNGQWCNPGGRRVGTAPATIADEVVDTNLWIKVPGESDGTCNGGPVAGDWWPAAAVELTQDVRSDATR